ncbi:hypothetical protein J4G48_0040655 [Bradyrhizobium barranii subsp. apii]|uniref:hypothetical protein n=1 Tax=Bradyrhizobium barranii TaxID=2992140 RepID=UPI001AA0B236|nr:hypothetical protein [Bradyrhizobium barranii]UPT95468.1 hypothetical protein J4G48_0040655 [Bradyrhizobium barranii subsp. apii]
MIKHVHYPRGAAPASTPVLWRCEAKRYSVCVDPDRDVYGTTPPKLEMWWWEIDRVTPKGAWVCGRFVLLSATKRWACPTEEEALESFMARKRKQIRILSHRLKEAEVDLALAYPKSHAQVFA